MRACLHACMCVLCAWAFARHWALVTVKGSLLKKRVCDWWREKKMNKGVRPCVLLDFQLIRCFVFPREGCENKIKLVSACGKYSTWMQQGDGKAEFVWEMHRVRSFKPSVSTVMLNDCQRRPNKGGVGASVWYKAPEKCPGFICCLWHKYSFSTLCVCMCVFSGFQGCRCCHAASSGYVICRTGSRQTALICIEKSTNELWHWSCFSWETEEGSDRVKEKVREIEVVFQRTSVVLLMKWVSG